MTDDDWRLDARCLTTDPETFYPDLGGSAQPAKAICGRCLAVDPCLKFALDNRIVYGIFGGKSTTERLRLIRSVPS